VRAMAEGYAVMDALVASSLATSKSEARRLIEGKGVYLNGKQVESVDAALTAQDFNRGLSLLRRGKQIIVLTIDK
jgi:tyrosyl-tRNA synthetase